MLRFRKAHSRGNVHSQINITPLIDVLLVLLVIFMVITPTIPTGLNAQIPQQASAPVPPVATPQSDLILNVDEAGALTLNHQLVESTAELSTKLYDIFKTRSDRTLFIRGDRKLEYDKVVHVIDAARGGGAVRIGLLTQPQE